MALNYVFSANNENKEETVGIFVWFMLELVTYDHVK